MILIKRTIKQIAEMCGGGCRSSNPELIIEGVCTDSRQAAAGRLFVPLVGERFDGHDFAEQAIAGGASAMLWQASRAVPAALEGVPRVQVKDTLAALQNLAAAYRSELVVRVVGITGSNGKTTTKDLTASILGTVYNVHKTEGNLNNEIGLPLTVLELDEDTEVAVLEMGMSGFGEIELLAKIAQPDAAIITNIGDAHLLQLGSREGIAKAKLEITAGLGEDGLLLYNGDEPLLETGLQAMKLPEGVILRTFGLGADNEWTAADIKLEPESSSFTVICRGEVSGLGTVRIPVPGQHNVSNALAAISVARFFGVPSSRIAEGLAKVQLTGMRIQPVKAFNGAVILNDSYNANPTSVRAAVDLVHELPGFGRKWAVLGDMLELGPEEEELHFEIGAYIASDLAISVLACGPLSRHTAEGAGSRAAQDGAERVILHFDDKEKLAEWLRGKLQPTDIVLVKGSRGMRMEQVVQALEKG